jgi:hypothetical protein
MGGVSASAVSPTLRWWIAGIGGKGVVADSRPRRMKKRPGEGRSLRAPWRWMAASGAVVYFGDLRPARALCMVPLDRWAVQRVSNGLFGYCWGPALRAASETLSGPRLMTGSPAAHLSAHLFLPWAAIRPIRLSAVSSPIGTESWPQRKNSTNDSIQPSGQEYRPPIPLAPSEPGGIAQRRGSHVIAKGLQNRSPPAGRVVASTLDGNIIATASSTPR